MAEPETDGENVSFYSHPQFRQALFVIAIIVNVFAIETSDLGLDAHVEGAVHSSWGVTAYSAVVDVATQHQLFKCMDKFRPEHDVIPAVVHTQRDKGPYGATLNAALQSLPLSFPNSPTIVLEAACALL